MRRRPAKGNSRSHWGSRREVSNMTERDISTVSLMADTWSCLQCEDSVSKKTFKCMWWKWYNVTSNNVPVFDIKPGRVCHEHNPGREYKWTPVAHMTVSLLINTHMALWTLDLCFHYPLCNYYILIIETYCKINISTVSKIIALF